MNEPLKKFQDLLRELFQFDCSDLDFGIYRIMNHKRDVIKQFITEDLPNAIAGELDSGALVDQSRAAEELAEVADQIRNTLARDAIDADGNLVMFQESEIGKKYLNLQSKTAGSRGRDALEVSIFNHLYAFFSRYYQEGDFISKRRYSKNQRYAIPYNGEEVYLYWANSDQYYVKTAEYFHDYTYEASSDITVHFKVQAANVEQDNVKGDKRFFLPGIEAITYDEKDNRLEIPFDYRPLTAQEEITYGKRNQQETILTQALTEIPEKIKKMQEPLAALRAEKSQNSDGEPITLLEHHLRQYTRRNTSDYFIHKDLKGFLSRELDFYLKNEVLSLDEMEAAGEDRAEGWFQMMRVIKSVGGRIIDLLNQIENFQKMLWEKRKFVTETQYCITIGNIDEDFHEDIAGCEAQWDEWKELFAIDKDQTDLFTLGKDKIGKRIKFLKAHPTLVLDTRHFVQDFVDRLVASFDDLNTLTDGLLIHSENYQALNLLQKGYREQVKCIYIDPPYNSKTSEILYKNNYKHSSWLSLIDNRIAISRQLSTIDGSLVVAIDENEQVFLGHLLMQHFSNYNNVCVSIVHNKKGIQGDHFSYNHDFAYFCIPPALSTTHGKPIPEDQWDYVNLRKWGRESVRSTAKNCFYPIFVEGDEIVGFGNVCDDDFHPGKSNVCDNEQSKRIAVYPVDSKGVERKWRYARDSVEGILHLLKSHTTKSGEIQIRKANDEKMFKTVWDDSKYIAGDYGTKWLTDLGLKVKEDLYPKSVHTVEDSIYLSSDRDSLTLDYFAGSGTTGHAVINLNREDDREDGGSRKFILVEMGEYFDTVLLPRVKKVTFTPEWKNGQPKRMATPEEAERSPRIVKYMRLESYEDALNNIAFDETSSQMALEFDDYLLRYMIKWETRASETLLNVEKLSRPFCYKMHIRADGQTREKVADIPETFNYLMGLHIETRRVYDDDGRYYLVYRGQTREGRRMAVIWRETEGWQKSDFERDKDFVVEQKFSDGVDEIFVNGDSFIREAKALEPMFKAQMFAEAGV